MLVSENYAVMGAIPIWVAYMATRGHGHKLSNCQEPCLGPWPYSSQGLSWYSGLLLSPRALKRTRVLLAILDHVRV